jgi:hypothetical protein
MVDPRAATQRTMDFLCKPMGESQVIGAAPSDMHNLVAIVFVTLTLQAQAVHSDSPETTIPAGVPLRVALEHRVRIKRAGEAIQGRLIEPIYVFDRMVIPAGSVVEGHVAAIGGVPFRRRFSALMSGNLTPRRDVKAQFDTLVLKDGSRLTLHTALAGGTAHTARVAKPRTKPEPTSASPGSQAASPDTDPATALAFKTPGKWRSLEAYMLNMFPYHPQAWSAGTLFTAELQTPLTAPLPLAAAATGPESGELRARLLTRISSATARKGSPVEAVVTRPQFSQDHRLLIPEGSRLLGEVVKSQKARFLHRNGKLLFTFRQIQVRSGEPQTIQGYLEGVEADWAAHLALDSEGTAQPKALKSRLIFPLIAATVAGLSFHQDYNAQGVPDLDSAGRAESGAVGLGLIGTVLAQIGPRREASAIAIMGAAFSIYTTFIARGEDVVLPADTPVTVSLGARP